MQMNMTLTQKIAALLTWGNVATIIIVIFLSFTSYIVGNVVGARELEPRILQITEVISKQEKRMETLALQSDLLKQEIRISSIEKVQINNSLKMSEMVGYLKAIASNMGIKKSDISNMGE